MTGDGIESKSSAMGILLACFAAFGGLLFGYDTGTISGIKEMPHWLVSFAGCDLAAAQAGTCTMPTSQESLVVSILSAGTFFGALASSPMGDYLGRRMGLIATCGVFCVGVALQCIPKYVVFVIGRLVAGFAVGLVSALVPLYQSECAPKKLRGAIVGCYQWAITIGLLIAAIVNNFTKHIDSNASWLIVIAIQFGWAAILAGGMFILPESPRYLISKGRLDRANGAMRRLVGPTASEEEVQNEIAIIQAALEAERKLGNTGYADFVRKSPSKIRLRTLIATSIQALQQLSGINFIFYYGTTFFKRSGFQNPFIITIITNVVNVGMTVPGILVVDKFGRRKMLLVGAAAMAVCQFLVAVVGTTRGGLVVDAITGNQVIQDPAAQKVLISFVCLYIAAFAAIWGPIPWIVCGETFPLSLRAKGMSLSAASNWIWNFAIGYSTPYLVDPSTPEHKTANLGVKVFFIWGAACIGCFVFTFLFVPETKGLSLEQVDILYRESTGTRSRLALRQKIIDSGTSYEADGTTYELGAKASKQQDIEEQDYKY